MTNEELLRQEERAQRWERNGLPGAVAREKSVRHLQTAAAIKEVLLHDA